MDMRNEKGQFLKGTHWRAVQPFRDKEWLIEHYVNKQMSAKEIADMFGVTDMAIYFWLKRNKIERRDVSAARKIKKWGLSGSDNPMWNKKGEANPRWQGGITPERQAFYVSDEWKKSCSAVWRRDNATCQRCGLVHSDQPDIPFHIHHIKPFRFTECRAEVSNLVLLCEICHHFVHSRRNTENEYISQE